MEGYSTLLEKLKKKEIKQLTMLKLLDKDILLGEEK